MTHYLLIAIFGISTLGVHLPDSSPRKERKKILKKAESLLNSNYRYGGNAPSGFDCSGFTQYVFRESVNLKLARSSSGQSRQGRAVKLSDAAPGDLVFFRTGTSVNHVGIIHKKSSKGLWMIHASSSRGVISEDISASEYWSDRLYRIKCLI